jgi:hypothetical protein
MNNKQQNDDGEAGETTKQSRQSTIWSPKQQPTRPQWWQLTLLREAASECGGGPSKYTIINNFKVAGVVRNIKVNFAECAGSKK